MCYQTHLLSAQLRSHLLSSLIRYPTSAAIETFAIKPHLHQANLLSILSCTQQFCYQLSFAIKFFPKNPPKMEKFLKILKSSFSGKLSVGMEVARVVAPSKGICQPFEKLAITTCIFTAKTRQTIHRPPTGARNTEIMQ